MSKGQRVLTLGGVFVHMPANDERRDVELLSALLGEQPLPVPTVHTPAVRRRRVLERGNQAVQQAIGTSNWHRLQMLYFTMSLHLRDEGRDYIHLRRESLQCAVRDHVAKAATFGRGEPALQVTGCRPNCTVCAPDDGRRVAPGELLTDGAPGPHGCDWCTCGIRFDDAWLEQQRSRLVDSSSGPERPARRGPFGRRRRA